MNNKILPATYKDVHICKSNGGAYLQSVNPASSNKGVHIFAVLAHTIFTVHVLALCSGVCKRKVFKQPHLLMSTCFTANGFGGVE
jgi:hypothetical protein